MREKVEKVKVGEEEGRRRRCKRGEGGEREGKRGRG